MVAAMRMGEFWADLQEAVPRVTPKRVTALLLLMLVAAGFLAAFAVVSRFIPPLEFERYGYLGVFLANLLPSMSVIIPAHLFIPGQALSVIVAAAGSVFWVAVAASVGSALGEITAYYVGYGGKSLLNLDRYERYRTAEKWMSRHGGLAISLFAFLPLFFFDFVGIAAGALRFPLGRFMVFCFLGRLPRAFVEIYFYTWAFENIISHLPSWFSAPYLTQ